jgi:uncharacterized protein (TIGR02099 family)
VSGLIRRLWRFAAGFIAVIVILAAVLVGLIRLALVQVPEYRDQIEVMAGEALGWPVEIGAMDARLGLQGPELRFTDARVLTRDRERTLVVATTGSMRFDNLALLRGKLRPGAVSLAGVALRIERDPAGRWRLLGEAGPALGDGLAAPGEGAELPRLADLPARRLGLERVRVEFQDLYRDLEPWEFMVDLLDLQIGGGQFQLSAKGKLPEALGSDLALSVTVTGQDERGWPRDWSAGVSFTALDLQAVGEVIARPERLPATGTLSGHLSAEADGDGLRRVAGEVLAHDVRPPRTPDQGEAREVVPYESLGAGFAWLRAKDGWQVQLTDLEVERGGRRWISPVATFALETDAVARRIEVKVDHAELEDLAPTAPWWPKPARALAGKFAPEGTVRDLGAHLDLPYDDALAPDIHIEARFDGLGLEPGERTPGFRDVSGTISGDRYAGRARLELRDGEVALPWLFRQPLALADAGATIDWARDDVGMRLSAPQFTLANDDATISGEATLDLPADQSSPRLEIEGLVRHVQLVSAPAYLPVGIMREPVVNWLDRALQSGRVEEARFQFSGPTRSFPFREGEGLFKVEFDMLDGGLDFAAGWPNATGIEAAVRFENEGLWAEVGTARLLDVEAGSVRVAIPDLVAGLLSVTGEARGELAALRELALEAELLESLLGPGLWPADITAGRATADVDLSLPLRALGEYRAQVKLQIEDGVVGFGVLGEPLRNLEADVRIDNARVTARDVTATLAGRPVAADVRVMGDGAIRLDGRGRLDADGLARVLRIPVDTWADGEADWVGHLQFPAPGSPAPLAMEVTSQLEGIAIDLPEPFRKAAAESRTLQVQGEFPRAELMDFRFHWAESLHVAARIDRSGPESVFGAVPGAVSGEPPGVVFSGAINRLDLGAWLDVEVPGELEPGGLIAGLAGGRVLVGELSAPMLALNDVLLDLSRAGDGWRLELAAEGAAGHVELPIPLYGDRAVTVRLDRLRLEGEPPGAASEAPDRRPPFPEEVTPSALHPARVPALDIEIGDLHYGAMRFGSVSARVLHESDGIELIGLEATGDGFLFQAEGRSRLSEWIDQSRLAVRLHSDNVGATLAYMGFGRSMDAREGRFEAEVTWQGGLRSDWLSAMEGNASITIRDGKLVGVEPGAGRVLGLLSIQALPRRLALDFKDVFGEGTSFDRISGDFRFAGGHAFTDNLIMRGPSADLGVVGRTGLVARDYDQTAVIGADLGRTLPLAGAVVGGPAVGAVLYLLSEMLRKPFQAQATYRLTGTWEDPIIERMGSAAAAAARSAPAEGPPVEDEEEPRDEGGEG